MISKLSVGLHLWRGRETLFFWVVVFSLGFTLLVLSSQSKSQKLLSWNTCDNKQWFTSHVHVFLELIKWESSFLDGLVVVYLKTMLNVHTSVLLCVVRWMIIGLIYLNATNNINLQMFPPFGFPIKEFVLCCHLLIKVYIAVFITKDNFKNSLTVLTNLYNYVVKFTLWVQINIIKLFRESIE